MNIMYFESPCGFLTAGEENGAICMLHFGRTPLEQGWMERRTEVMECLSMEMEEYFAGKRKTFDLLLAPKGGTAFLRKVWNALMEIPYGCTKTYQEVAAEISCPRGARAVGNGAHCNPIGILIPCHRLIGASGKLCGFAGGLDVKRYLLEIENKNR